MAILSKCSTINDFKRVCTDVLSVSFSDLEDVENIDNFYSAQRRLIQDMKYTEICYTIESDLRRHLSRL